MNVATILKNKGRAVATVGEAVKLIDIVTMLSEKKIGAIVVMDDTDSVAGIISERDVIRIMASEGAKALEKPAKDVMIDQIVTCSEEETIDELMMRMTTRRFRHLPVISDGDLAGIISIGDVVKLHIAAVEMEASALRSYIATG